MAFLNLWLLAVLWCGSGYADKCIPSIHPPEKSSGCCGVAKYDLKKIPGFYAAIDEYPWTALLEYKKDNKTSLLCSAVLISGRYALSAGHCFRNPRTANVPVNIRLGDYDLTNDGPDCEGEEENRYCNDGALTIPIEKYIVHPEFKYNGRTVEHDIVLIKLKETAPYNDFIRPICLPTSDVTLAPRSFTLPGWAVVNGRELLPRTKLRHVNLPFVDTATCRLLWNSTRFFKVESGQLCAGGDGKDACHGDAGAPLINRDDVFELAGLVSFGFSYCGEIGKPGVYTKVFAYMDWIRENIAE